MPLLISDTEILDIMRDCTRASMALSGWFKSQEINPAKAAIMMSILLTGMADTGKLSDKKIDKLLRHVRTLTRALIKQHTLEKRKSRQ